MSAYFHFERRYEGQSSGNRITYAVQRLIMLNVAVFAVQLLLEIPLGGYSAGTPGGIVTDLLAFSPTMLMKGCIWQPFTYMFLHSNLMHLFLNMVGLYFFGPDVERILSTRQFFRFYIICGVAGALAEFALWLIRTGSVSPTVVGASGATTAVLVAFAVAYPDREVFLIPFPFPVNARALVIIFIVMNLMSAMQNSSQAWMTHFGGLAAGYAYMKLVPVLRTRLQSWQGKTKKSKDEFGSLGDAVDNIFKFEDEKRRRR
ncbi:MAG: rhomboid family intramembrane serine protease [Candidatus Hydrogenedentes bacterium]|nr:rhomboid family intramembrane serine protease [Candidatus Hydrogenedentota bacterium]